MGTLRREMTENGIEPRQIFAFDAAGKKNAADIELVIDALDLAYTRPGITTFVVVTRDGGFSSLGRKLHELGKAVVVCADSSAPRRCAPSPTRSSSCPPRRRTARRRRTRGRSGQAVDLGPEGDRALDDARAAAIREIKALASREGARVQERRDLLSRVGQIFANAVPTLAVARSAYPGLREFLQWALADTPYCVFAPTRRLALPARAADEPRSRRRAAAARPAPAPTGTRSTSTASS